MNEDMARNAARYLWWRENIDWLMEDGDGLSGCAFQCQIPLDIIDKASDAELMDAIADFHLAGNK